MTPETNDSPRLDPVGAEPTPEAQEETSFGELLSEFERGHSAPGAEDRPAFIDGVVLSLNEQSVLVDVGRKHEGTLPLDAVLDPAGKPRVKPGDTIGVNIGGRDENGYYLLSLFKVTVPKDWSGLEAAFAEKAIITGTVEELIKGGLRVDVGARAFLPASRSGARDIPEMEKLVGQQIECRITKLDVEKEDVVVDRRGILEERAAKAKEEAFAALQEGAIVEGAVRNVMDFGAFVDLGGVDGLLHVSDMTWVRSAKPSDVVKSGDTVRVKILRIDREKKKVSLGMKQLTPDPWTVATASLEPNTRVRGKIVRVMDFGAFVELQPGVEGLIHVSEMSWSRKQKRPADIVTVGEMVDVVVLSVKPEEKRIGLGLKQTLGDPWEEAVGKFPVGAVVEGPVTNLAPFGAFVELGEGVEGMIHIGDIVNDKRLQHPREALTAGQVVKAAVLEVDHERKRFRLGMKQLEPTSADEYIAEHKVGDSVTGRIVDVSGSTARVELAEGVRATCRIIRKQAPAESKPASADLNSSIAALAARWKQGTVSSADTSGPKAGEVKQFLIRQVDPAKKLIEVELEVG
ncbi:MAG: S1 RNA-binding domain-containing protein [Bryobacteraceae bacterium]